MGRYYWKHFAAAIAALSAAATLLSVLFKVDCIKAHWGYGILGAAIVLGGSFAYAWWQTRSKKKITLDLSAELKLTVCEGDLFEQKGIICIPFNEYFDTHVGNGVVDEDSIHGMFINRFFKDRIQDLEQKIRPLLPSEGVVEQTRRFDYCPNKKYPLGTCINIREGENTYVLFALTHFDDNDKANVSRTEYTEVVGRLMEYLDGMAGGKPVYMPLFGTHLSRLRRTPQRILLHLADTIDFNDSCSIPGGANIIVKSLNEVNVNLTTLEYIVKKGISVDEKDE